MKKPKLISPEDLKDRMDTGSNFVIVDVLSPEDFSKSHIKGAMNIPLTEIEAKGGEWLNRNIDIIVYSDGPACQGAKFAQEHLKKMGYRVWQLEGGFQAWSQNGYPIDGDPNYKHHAIKTDTVPVPEPKKPEPAAVDGNQAAKPANPGQQAKPGQQPPNQKKKAA